MNISIDKTDLYRQTVAGKLQIWSIHAIDSRIIIEWGDEDGQRQTQEEIIEFGIGGRTQVEQLMSRVNSRISKKLDKGYVFNRAHAMSNKPTNRLGLPKPMLATPIKKIKDIDFDSSFIQCKYDGHRCLIHFDGTSYTVYSRNGKIISSVWEILDAVKESWMEPGDTLDGELYSHGVSLQTITSWVKKRQSMTASLKYIVYDVITPAALNYKSRLACLQNMNLQDPIVIAPTGPVKKNEVQTMLNQVIQTGYEGLILRRAGFPYEDGKRSRSLVKIKQWDDNEFTVIDVLPSREGYAILVCEMEDGKRFRVTAPGDMQQKLECFINRLNYIGKTVTVKYANFTEDGIPFHPIALHWRQKDDE